MSIVTRLLIDNSLGLTPVANGLSPGISACETILIEIEPLIAVQRVLLGSILARSRIFSPIVITAIQKPTR